MPAFYDQLNREIFLPQIPQRIISIVPSQTELLFYLGLDKEVVGITKFCVRPANKFKSSTKVGGTKQLDIGKITALKPDLIIANKEENERAQVEELMGICPVWISDISNLEEAVDMIERVGVLVGRETQARQLSSDIKRQFDELTVQPSGLRVAYLIWRKPYMAAGSNTFIDNMLQKCRLINIFNIERYPEVDNQMLINAKPDLILLSSEPYPFREKHIAEFKALLPSANVKLVDGELFSWYGSRLLLAPPYFRELINGLESV